MSLSVTRRQKLSRTPDPRFNRDDGKVVTPVMASLRERCSWKGTRDSCRPASRHRVFDERPRRTQILIANSEIPSSFQCQPNLEYFVSNFVPRSNSRWRLNPKQKREIFGESQEIIRLLPEIYLEFIFSGDRRRFVLFRLIYSHERREQSSIVK